MNRIELIEDLYAYNDWANAKVLSLCEGLTDQQLDAPREMGFGTLRATLFHILTAEIVWMERWQSVPWRPFPVDPEGMSIEAMEKGLAEVAAKRRDLIAEGRENRWSNRIAYMDSKKTEFDHKLCDLLLHVANHSVHHRAQALNFLRHFDRTVVAGIDYIFYRLACTTVEQSQDAMESLRAYGLAVAESAGRDAMWDAGTVARMFVYDDWANANVLSFAADLDGAALDREFEMGLGSIRKTLLHLRDAEKWWIQNWTVGPNPFPKSPPETSIASLSAEWKEQACTRDAFIKSVDADEASRVVEILAGGPPTRFRVGESVAHLAIHATHHRAQLINMLRHVGAPIKNIDLLYAIDVLPAA